MRIGIGKKIGSVYVGVSKSFGGKSKGGSGNYFEVSLDEALGMGLKPCKKCVE